MTIGAGELIADVFFDDFFGLRGQLRRRAQRAQSGAGQGRCIYALRLAPPKQSCDTNQEPALAPQTVLQPDSIRRLSQLGNFRLLTFLRALRQ